MNMIECLGLDFLDEEEETFRNFLGAVCVEGKAITGYYGYPYLNREFGEAQFVVRTELNKEEKRLEVTGLDTHLSGRAVWDVLLSEVNIRPKDADSLTRRVVVTRGTDGGGMAVVNLVNADVLPSFLHNDRVKMQMVAFPEHIQYYPDEEAYAADQPKDEKGEKWLLADGTMMPVGLLRNHAPDNPDNDKDHYSDNFMLIRGTVKKIFCGMVDFGEEPFPAFVRTIIHTEHGDLEIAHDQEQVDEAQREYMKEGATVVGLFILSGDVAIYEYENGIIRDEEHNLALLRYTICKGEAKRMASVLRENAVYTSEASGKVCIGPEEIIARMEYVRDSEKKFYAHLATIIGVDEGEEELPYAQGKRCVVLAENEEDNYVSIAFLDLDEEGYITKLTVSTNGRYHFKIDEPIRPKNILDDFDFPESVVEAIFSRAKYHGFLDREIENETVLSALDNVKIYENNAQQMVSALADYPQIADDEKYANIFGYLFAKAIEKGYTQRNGDKTQFQLVVRYSPNEAITGNLRTDLTPEIEEKVKVAYDYGKQFYSDLKFFYEIRKECSFEEELCKALVIVQQIGEAYAKHTFS